MSTKFEQLLDYLVNEETDKANELFHEIVVERSRDIYENLIAAEAKDEEADGEEAANEEEDLDENADEFEDTYEMADEADPTDALLKGTEEPSDDMPDDMSSDMSGDMPGDEDEDAGEDEAMMDIKNAIEELEAAFAELQAAQGDEGNDSEFDADSEFDSGDDEGDDGEKSEEMMSFQEGRRLTREYVEKVGNDWDKNSQKSQGQAAGADTGDKMGSPSETKSTVNTKAAATAPKTGAHAGNILGDKGTGEGTNVGTKPAGKTGGLVKNSQDMKTGNGNVPGGSMGVKNLAKVPGGHGAEKKSAAPGPVGSGSGDKAGQTSVSSDKSFLKHIK